MRFFAILSLLLALWPARAEFLPVANSSFEQPVLPRSDYQVAPGLEGWELEGTAGVFVNNGHFGNKLANGVEEQVAYLNGTKAGSLAQMAATEIRPLTTYAATAWVGLRKDMPLTNGASLLLRLQAYDAQEKKVLRTLAVKEILVGREQLSEDKLTDFTATFTSGITAPVGSLRLLISVGEVDKDGKGDWTLDHVRVEMKPAPAETVARLQQAASGRAATQTASAKTVRYNRDIRPILSENCFACHGPDSAARKAGLRLDRFADATAARKDSPLAIVPGQPGDSDVVARLITTDEDDIMPPPKSKKTLTAKQIELIKTWIAEGAEYEVHWAYQAPAKPELPAVAVANPIDKFILSRLRHEGLKPAPEADRRTLARRASFDLTGLPPSTEMLNQFVNDRSPDAYEKYVDRLMAKTAWGEHRGRYWLDVARYADTHGIHFDNFREMWTYRQWVINAFNQNMPFDRFTLEQLAGDLLPNPTLEQLTASGFNRCNITSNEGGLIDEEYFVLYMKDRSETAAQVWMGATTMCAGCHDHKFDPITTKEYYSLAAFFNNSTVSSRDGNKRDPAPVAVIPTLKDRQRWFDLETLTPAAKERVAARQKAGRPDFEKWMVAPEVEPFQNAILAFNLELHAPLTNELPKHKAIEGHIATKAFQSVAEEKLELGDFGDFERDAAWGFGAWVRIDNKDNAGGILARMDEKNSFRGWDLFMDKDRPVAHFVHKWPDNAVRVASKARIEPKKWTHIFVTYDGSAKPSGVRIYVNGKITEVDSDNKALTESIRTTVPVTVAHRHSGGVMKDVGVQDVRVYKGLLSPEAVAGIARNTRAAWLAAKASDQRAKEEIDELYAAWLAEIDPNYRKEAGILASLEHEDRSIRKRGSIAHVMKEKPDEAMAYVLFRGEYDRRRDRVLAGTPEILPPMSEELPRNRLGLAKWLLQPSHPLTARVTVNRFWQEIFGNGLVLSAGDFGVTGEIPSHPELLDWLAVDFMESGWDVKRFFKQIVMSQTYRQAATVTAEKLQKDPANRLLARGPRFRMDAEMIRDAALAASGLLVEKIGGPSVKPYQPEGVWETVAMRESDTRAYQQDAGENLYRRSLYTFWKRSAPPASMDIFNAPSRESCTVRRERTDTPLQALVTLNDTQFVEAARALAESALKNSGSKKARLNFMAERILARPLRHEELKVLTDVLADLLAAYRKSKDDAERIIAVGESKRDAELRSTELAAYTMAANQLLNLDEAITK